MILSRRGTIAASRPATVTAPAVVGVATPGSRATSGSVTVTPPAGAASYIAVVVGFKPNLTVPSGWTEIYNSGDYYLIFAATGTPGATWNTTDGVIVLVIGYDKAFTSAVTAGTVPTAPTATATGPCLVLRATWFIGDVTPTLGYPAGATLGRTQKVQEYVGYSISGIAAHSSQASAGSVGTAVFTNNKGHNTDNPAITALLYPA